LTRKSGLTGGLPWGFYGVALSGFLFEMGLFMTQPILTLHYLDIGASIMFIGFIIFLQSSLLIVLRMPLTLLAKRVGEKRLLAAAYFAQTIALIVIGLAPSPIWLYLVPATQMLASGSFFQLITFMNSNQAPPDRKGDALGRHMTIVSIGMFVGPALCGVLVTSLGYRGVFYVASFFPAAGLTLLLYSTRGIESAGHALRSFEIPSFRSLKVLFSDRNVAILAFIRAIYSISNTLFLILLSIYAVRVLGYSPTDAALLYSLVGIANTFIKIPSGWVSDRVGYRLVLFATFSIVVVDYLAFAYFNSFILLALAVTFFGACWGARAVTEWAFLASFISPGLKSIAMGYMESFWDIGASLGSLLAGFSAGVLSYPTIFTLLALLNLPTLPAIYAMRKPSKTIEIEPKPI
jgi:predicted MFS family arabinose efflux permease